MLDNICRHIKGEKVVIAGMIHCLVCTEEFAILNVVMCVVSCMCPCISGCASWHLLVGALSDAA